MSKKTKRMKAAAEGRFVPPGGKEPEPRYACPFPGCGHPFTKEEKLPNACNEHRQFIADYIFCANHLKTAPIQRKSGIHVPGSTAEVDAYIEDFEKKGKGKYDKTL